MGCILQCGTNDGGNLSYKTCDQTDGLTDPGSSHFAITFALRVAWNCVETLNTEINLNYT